MAKLFQKIFKRNRKCTVIKSEITEQYIKECQEKLRKVELEVEKSSNKKASKIKHYNSLEEMLEERGYCGEIHE